MAGEPVRTERLEVRAPRAGDRGRFVSIFSDPAFMGLSDGPLSEPEPPAGSTPCSGR